MKLILLALPFAVAGCSPVGMVPIVVPVDPDLQAEIDQEWRNMLSPPNRLDRTLLLDTIVAYQLHHLGADRVAYRSEKVIDGMTVVMHVTHERTRPEAGAFELFVYDRDGRIVRWETYTAGEVLDHAHEMFRRSGGPATMLADPEQEPLNPRWAAVQAVTQPADGRP
jgi:hypothetical protein